MAEIHREYIDAGSQVIQTNTFGANRYKLAAHGLDGQVAEINRAGVELARRVVLASFKDVLIAGDVGPLGVRLAPFGRVQPEEARQAFAEQIAALAEAGVDLLIIETISDLFEIGEAIRAARAGLRPARGRFDDLHPRRPHPAGRLARPRSPGLCTRAGADVIGVNCSGGPAQICRILRQMRQAAPGGAASRSCPTPAGPSRWAGASCTRPTRNISANTPWPSAQAGASLIGGCCGTTPQHIAAMRLAP